MREMTMCVWGGCLGSVIHQAPLPHAPSSSLLLSLQVLEGPYAWKERARDQKRERQKACEKERDVQPDRHRESWGRPPGRIQDKAARQTAPPRQAEVHTFTRPVLLSHSRFLTHSHTHPPLTHLFTPSRWRALEERAVVGPAGAEGY